MKKHMSILILPAFFILCASCQKEKKTEEAALKMQQFVAELSAYAKGIDPQFIIIPQNGAELAFNETDPANGINGSYVSAIDGIGIEELFYNETLLEEDNRLGMLRVLKNDVRVMVADYVTSDADYADAILRSESEGFLCFPRSSGNYDYKDIPPVPMGLNTDNIDNLQEAQNYLYLINTDNFSSRQNMIADIMSTNYDVVLIDLFFNEETLSNGEVLQLKTKANGGSRLVLCYINVGAAENWRYYWGDNWKLHNPSWLKKKYEGYDDEIWVEFWDQEWKDIIYGNENSYIKKIIDAGFDGAYLDNVEGYYFLFHN